MVQQVGQGDHASGLPETADVHEGVLRAVLLPAVRASGPGPDQLRAKELVPQRSRGELQVAEGLKHLLLPQLTTAEAHFGAKRTTLRCHAQRTTNRNVGLGTLSGRHQALQHRWRRPVIRIEKGDPGGAGGLKASGTGPMHAQIVGQTDRTQPRVEASQLLQQLGRGIAGVVIDHQDLDVCERLGLQAGEGRGESRFAIAHRHDDADARPVRQSSRGGERHDWTRGKFLCRLPTARATRRRRHQLPNQKRISNRA